MEVEEMLKRSAWQEKQDAENALRALPGFDQHEGSGQYSGGEVGFNREGRWWKRASESEYSEHRMGFFGGRK